MKVADFYTYFDSNFLCRGIALYTSLSRHCENFKLYVLCLDEQSFVTLNKLAMPNLVPISLQQLEVYDSELVSKKKSRSKIEYYFTCTASFGCYLFNHYSIAHLTYLDGDTYFYSSPTEFLEHIKSYSIAITPHRFPKVKKHNEKYGIYNVGWVSFKNDSEGLRCLSAWRKDCIEWCHNYLDNDRFGDQKYLDKWPVHYQNVKIIDHYGINAGPWNLQDAIVELKNQQIYINQEPLILYHFHNLYRIQSNLYKLGIMEYDVKPIPIIRNTMYREYIKEVMSIHKNLRSHSPKNGFLKKKFSVRNFWPLNDLFLHKEKA